MTKLAVLVKAKDEDPKKGVEIKLQGLLDGSLANGGVGEQRLDADLELGSIEDARTLLDALRTFLVFHDQAGAKSDA